MSPRRTLLFLATLLFFGQCSARHTRGSKAPGIAGAPRKSSQKNASQVLGASLAGQVRLAQPILEHGAAVGEKTRRASAVPQRSLAQTGQHHHVPLKLVQHRHQALSAKQVPGSAQMDQQSPDSEASRRERPFYMDLKFLSKIIFGMVVFQLLAVATFEFFHRQWAEVDFDAPLPPVQEQQRTALTTIFHGLGALTSPYCFSPAGFKGRIYFAVVIFLGLMALFLAYVMNMWQKEWWDLFTDRDSAKFVPLMLIFIVIIICWVTNDVYSQYIRAMLYIHWRTFMTKRLTSLWLSSHAHFFMQLPTSGIVPVDNPDQRIQEDTHLFVLASITLGYEFLNSLGQLIIFVPLLLYLSPTKAFGVFYCPGWLLYLSAIYSSLGTCMTHCIGKHLIKVGFTRQRYEADFRHTAMHVRDNAESITLYNSEANEEETMRKQFEHIKVIWWQYMMYTKRLSFFTIAYSMTQMLVPIFLLAPSYFNRDITLGDLFQLTGALGAICTAFDWFINVYGPLTDWRATADRLLSFEKALAAAQKRAKEATGNVKTGPAGPRELADAVASASGASNGTPNACVMANIGEVRLPNGDTLWRNLRLEILCGQKVLISGREGVGKSVLFKTFAGVWPFVDESKVRLTVEDTSDVLFVPQRPALPKHCSLRDALSYPELATNYTDSQLLAALEEVKLTELLSSQTEEKPEDDKRLGDAAETPRAESGLDRTEDWSMRLSPGMQQRLAIGHAILRKPRLLFLDEATSNVGKEAAVELYATISRHLPANAAIVSISHDVATLQPLHDVHMMITGEGDEKVLAPVAKR